MSLKKSCYLLCLIMLCWEGSTLAQVSIDSFISTLHNIKAESTIAMVLPKRTADGGKVYFSTPERVLTNSSGRSVRTSQLKKEYNKYLLISKLIQSLDDSERDWYADLLLYNLNLPDISTSNILGCDNRQKWLRK